MAEEALLKQAKEDMKKAQDALRRDLADIRAGRANAGLLNRINVNYYGAPTPLNQMAAINIPEPRVLMITPYDKSSLDDIEKAILASDLGLNPALSCWRILSISSFNISFSFFICTSSRLYPLPSTPSIREMS